MSDCQHPKDEQYETIFILMDCTDYEGCRPLRAFKSKEVAQLLKKKAEVYDAKNLSVLSPAVTVGGESTKRNSWGGEKTTP